MVSAKFVPSFPLAENFCKAPKLIDVPEGKISFRFSLWFLNNDDLEKSMKKPCLTGNAFQAWGFLSHDRENVPLGAGLSSDVKNLSDLILAECGPDFDMALVLNLRDLRINIGSWASKLRREKMKKQNTKKQSLLILRAREVH